MRSPEEADLGEESWGFSNAGLQLAEASEIWRLIGEPEFERQETCRMMEFERIDCLLGDLSGISTAAEAEEAPETTDCGGVRCAESEVSCERSDEAPPFEAPPMFEFERRRPMSIQTSAIDIRSDIPEGRRHRSSTS